MRGAWLGFSWGHTQHHFIRAVLESVAFEYAYYLTILRELIPSLNLIEARVIGGGSRSNLWNQIKADVLGVPYQPLKGAEFGTWGSAMIAGRAAGIFGDLAEVAYERAHPEGNVISPSANEHDLYQPLVREHIRWQTILSESFEQMSDKSIE